MFRVRNFWIADILCLLSFGINTYGLVFQLIGIHLLLACEIIFVSSQVKLHLYLPVSDVPFSLMKHK